MFVHVSWPSPSDPIYLANTTEQNARKSLYGVNSVPWTQFDGVIHSSSYLTAYNNRMAVPCHLDILACRNGGTSSGIVSIRLIAEQDLGMTSTRAFAILLEDDVPGAGYWSSSTFPYAFRDNLMGVAGTVVEFSAPYPDTVFVEVPYNLSPSWVATNLYLATFVQAYSSSDKEVANSRFDNFLGLPQGMEDGAPGAGATSVTAEPNPSIGLFTVSASMPEGVSGLVTIFDMAGRELASFDASALPVQVAAPGPGVYFARLSTSSGGLDAARVVVLE